MIFRVLGMAVLLVALGGCSDEAGARSAEAYAPPNLPYVNVDNAELKALLDQGIPIYDIRRPEEWRQTGVVQGSRLLTLFDKSGRAVPDFWPTFTSEIQKEQPVILICRTGNRTSTAARLLAEQLGYTKVYNVRAGITGWIGGGNPVVRE